MAAATALFLSLLAGLSSDVSCCSAALTAVTFPWTCDDSALKAQCGGWGWVVGGLITCGQEADRVVLCGHVSPRLPVKKLTQFGPYPVPCSTHTAQHFGNSVAGRAGHSSTQHGHRYAAGRVVAIRSHHVFEWSEFLGVCFL